MSHSVQKGQINVCMYFSYTPVCYFYFYLYNMNVCTVFRLLFPFSSFSFLHNNIRHSARSCISRAYFISLLCHLCFLYALHQGLENISLFGSIHMLLAWFYRVVLNISGTYICKEMIIEARKKCFSVLLCKNAVAQRLQLSAFSCN